MPTNAVFFKLTYGPDHHSPHLSQQWNYVVKLSSGSDPEERVPSATKYYLSNYRRTLVNTQSNIYILLFQHYLLQQEEMTKGIEKTSRWKWTQQHQTSAAAVSAIPASHPILRPQSWIQIILTSVPKIVPVCQVCQKSPKAHTKTRSFKILI